jgi:two-component system chemotaxis response regulator CheB
MSGSGHNSARCKGRSARASAAVAFAASAGSLAPLMDVVSGFSRECPAAVIVAMHTGPRSVLPALLAPRCRLRVKHAEDGEPLRAGTVYIAPALRQVVVNADRTMSVLERDRVRFVRPSADWLFTSLAASYGEAAIAVVLSGYRDDGARGAVRVQRAGGHVIVQDPATCKVPEMPLAALQRTRSDSKLAPEFIVAAIADRLASVDFKRERLRFNNPFAA